MSESQSQGFVKVGSNSYIQNKIQSIHKICTMGDTPSTEKNEDTKQPNKGPLTATTEWEDHYITENLSSISLRNKTSYLYFWVDPKIYNSENAKYERYLSQYFELQGLSSVQSLENKLEALHDSQKIKVICAASLDDEDYRSLSENTRIKNMFLFCQNQERARLLMSNFPRIVFAKFDIIQLKNAILQLQEQDATSAPKSNILVLVEEDTNLLNQYRINFHSLTCRHSKKNATRDFFALANHLFSDQKKAIQDFQDKVISTTDTHQRAMLFIKQALKRGFLWEMIYTLPRITINPKQLAYLRLPFKELYQGIKNCYKMDSGEAYMVLTPTEEELQKLKDVNNFLIFTSFTKAYTNEKVAYQHFKKTPGSFFVRVILPLLHEGNHIPSKDFGYYINHEEKQEANVIFNIYNFFLIEQFEPSLKQITLTYGSLADVAYKREHRRETYRLNPFEENLMRNYDYLQDLTSQINSQATVLQMSGYFKESLQVHEKMFEEIRKSQPDQEAIDTQTIELGDAYKRDGQYSKAEQYYLSVKKGGKKYFKSLVHMADLYLSSGEKDKLERIIKEIEGLIHNVSKSDLGETFKARNYIGLQKMEKGNYVEASKLYKNLIIDISDYYDFRYQGIPLVHEIYTNRAECQTKLNNLPEALNILETTISWQKICQGSKSKNLQKTQRLFKSLSDSYRESQKSAVSKRAKKTSSLATQPKKEESFSMPVNVNQSDVNILLETGDKQPKKPPGKLPSLQQSAINIVTTNDGNARKQIQESSINIDI